jgi:aryl-alcohol dehydrogenase-like predicted oxidoreductase
VIGARTEAQLRENLGAVGWTLDGEHVAMLDAARCGDATASPSGMSAT